MVSGDVYNGMWNNGRKNGKGVYSFANGDLYDGFFSNGLRQGKGKYNWNDNSFYDGNIIKLINYQVNGIKIE